ncbi:Lipid IVA 3-deoxy-D-manno-octulosonic acid transferase [often with also] [uncultured Candidatus Thioglobus sp.]|nr:Lipid IVA 3-deoxy-D-manno-octulosonic acid transferase [often with also] [uncultured Candidatus Thioglobus sp.]
MIDKLIKDYPEHQILVTSTTPTGSQAIKDTYQDKILHYYFPFDLSLIVNRYIKKINPKICILLETEIWPNLIHSLNKNNIPSLLINARLSPRSLEKYQKFAPKLAKQTLNKLNVIATQNPNSAQRFIQLGTDKNKVIMAGNIKFEQNPNANKKHTEAIKTIIGSRKVVVFASTHKGEEQDIINAYLQRPLDALMLIIPRHPERFNEVYKLAKKHKIKVLKRSENTSSENYDMLLGDSMGEMMSYFEVADVVFMGGSLVATGGHNMLEPAVLSKPILFGLNVFNFSEISADLLAQNGAIQVQNADELLHEITQLLEDDKKAKSLGDNANQYFTSQQGALDILMKQIQLWV